MLDQRIFPLGEDLKLNSYYTMFADGCSVWFPFMFTYGEHRRLKLISVTSMRRTLKRLPVSRCVSGGKYLTAADNFKSQ